MHPRHYSFTPTFFQVYAGNLDNEIKTYLPQRVKKVVSANDLAKRNLLSSDYRLQVTMKNVDNNRISFHFA
jgi:hypothetical protein